MIALMLYSLILRIIGKKQTAAHIFVSFIFCFFLLGILTMTGVWFKRAFSPRIVYIPFVDMVRGPIATILNVILFVPLGFFLPMLYEKYDKIGKIALTGFLVSLSVEIAQLFGTGTTDINDLITNTIGTCLGYGFYKLLYKVMPKSWRKKISIEGNWCYCELLLFWICSLLIMITIQPNIFKALFTTGGEIHSW